MEEDEAGKRPHPGWTEQLARSSQTDALECVPLDSGQHAREAQRSGLSSPMARRSDIEKCCSKEKPNWAAGEPERPGLVCVAVVLFLFLSALAA